MIGYVTLGTNDIARARAYYDALLEPLGIRRIMEFGPRGSAWGSGMEKPALGVMTPFDGKPATGGNGTMVAIAVESPAQVDAAYQRALALGGRDEGPAGPRGDGFYAGYFRDPDGNKLNFFCLTGK